MNIERPLRRPDLVFQHHDSPSLSRRSFMISCTSMAVLITVINVTRSQIGLQQFEDRTRKVRKVICDLSQNIDSRQPHFQLL
jgi:hypothetical protein